MSLLAYRGSPTRSGMGRAQVMLSVVEIALEKSALGMKSFGEELMEEPIFSTIAGCKEGAIVDYDCVLDVGSFVRPD